MKIIRIIKHIGIVLAGLILVLGVPLWCTGYISSLFSEDPDAVSSASVISDQPSGNYVIMINKTMHPDKDKLDDWIRFFSGGDVLYIFEDICACAASGDSGGIEMAWSFRSRLPENQMKVVIDDPVLIMSRADRGLYDIIIMSQEFADAFHCETAFNENCSVIKLMNLPGDNNHFGNTFVSAQ